MPDPQRIRFGYHGSLRAAREIVLAAGRAEDDVDYHEYDIMDPFRALRAGELDVMIVKFTVDEPDLVCSRVLTVDERAALLGARHPLAGRGSVSVEELADFEGFRRPGSFPAYVWDQVVPPVTPAGRKIHRRHELTTATALMDVLARTDAVHMSVLSLADIAPTTVRVIPIHDLPAAPVALARCHDRRRAAGFVADAEAALTAVAR